MKLIDTFTEFTAKGDLGMRSLFEAAMTKRVKEEGYKMSDLLYELFQCQLEISSLRQATDHLHLQLNSKSLKVSKKKKKEKK